MGIRVRNPTTKEMWERARGETLSRRLILAMRAAAVSETRLIKSKRLPATADCFCPEKTGSSVTNPTPARVTAMPAFSLLVMCSLRKTTPATTVIRGWSEEEIEAVRDEERLVPTK